MMLFRCSKCDCRLASVGSLCYLCNIELEEEE